MMHRINLNLLLASSMLMLGLLSGCGGSESYDSGGIEGTGVQSTSRARGSISGFGSIFVNGVEYHTEQASIRINGESGQLEQALKLGMVVDIEGTLQADGQSGQAQRVEFRSQALGPISAIQVLSSRSRQLTVLGQILKISEDTELHGLNLSNLALGQVVSASGFFDGQSQLQTSHLSLQAAQYQPGQSLALETQVASLQADSQSFSTHGGLTVDYSQASWSGFTAPSVGQRLFITGSNLTAQRLIASRLQAVQTENRPQQPQKIEGVISRFTSLADFSLGDLQVDGSKASILKGQLEDLKIGQRIEVSGQQQATGILQASQIWLKTPAEIRISGLVEQIDINQRWLQVAGQRIELDSRTRFQDASQAQQRFFGLDQIRLGDRLDLLVNPLGETLVASRLGRTDEDPQAQFELRGPIKAIQGSTLWLWDKTLDLSLVASDPLISQLQANDVIEVKVQVLADGRWQVQRLEFDDEFNHRPRPDSSQNPDGPNPDGSNPDGPNAGSRPNGP